MNHLHVCFLSMNSGSTTPPHPPSFHKVRHVHLSCTNTGDSSTLNSANISQRLCHHIALHTAHKAMITHSTLSGLSGDVIWSCNCNTNIPRETCKVCVLGAAVWWSCFLLSGGRSDRDRLQFTAWDESLKSVLSAVLLRIWAELGCLYCKHVITDVRESSAPNIYCQCLVFPHWTCSLLSL